MASHHANTEKSRPGLSLTDPTLNLTIRDSSEADIPRVQAIYAFHVLHGLASFEEEPPSIDELESRRVDVLGRGLPYFVAEMDREVVGYCYAAPYRSRRRAGLARRRFMRYSAVQVQGADRPSARPDDLFQLTGREENAQLPL